MAVNVESSPGFTGMAVRWTLGGWTLFILSTVTLSLLVPGAVGAGVWTGYDEPAWWAFSIVMVSGVSLSALLAAGTDRIVRLVYWVFVYVFLGLAPLAQLVAHRFPLGAYESYPKGTLTQTSWIILVGLAACAAGRWAGARTSLNRGPASRLFSRQARPSRVRLVGWLSLPVAFGMLLVLGDPGAILSSREAVSATVDESVGTSAIQLALITTPAFLALLFTLPARRARTGRPPVYSAALVTGLVVTNVLVNNPAGNSRTWFGTVAFALIVGFVAGTKTQFRVILGSLLVVFVALFPYSDVLRYDDRTVFSAPDPLVNKGDYDSFQQIANGARVVEHDGFALGRQISGSALFFVPRSAWESKPVDTGVYIAERTGYTFTNLSAPLWVEAFVDFGYFGVVGVFYIFGRLSEKLERAWLQRRKTGYELLAIAAPPLAAYQMILLRGSLLQACGRLAVMLILIIYCHPKHATDRRPVALTRRSAPLHNQGKLQSLLPTRIRSGVPFPFRRVDPT